VQQIELLGKAMLYDKQLSINRNEACAFCHMPETGLICDKAETHRSQTRSEASAGLSYTDHPSLQYFKGQGSALKVYTSVALIF
jgi:cytochrome c peroxidase